MQQTANFHLNQYEMTDRIQMENFNNDNETLDAALKALTEKDAALEAALANSGNCRIVTGSYTGAGRYGSSNACHLTFSGKPLVVFVQGDDGRCFFAVWGGPYAPALYSGANPITEYLTWSSTGLSWYGGNTPGQQLNAQAETYRYIALLAAE